MGDAGDLKLNDGEGQVYSRSQPNADDWSEYGYAYRYFFAQNPVGTMSFEAFVYLSRGQQARNRRFTALASAAKEDPSKS